MFYSVLSISFLPAYEVGECFVWPATRPLPGWSSSATYNSISYFVSSLNTSFVSSSSGMLCNSISNGVIWGN